MKKLFIFFVLVSICHYSFSQFTNTKVAAKLLVETSEQISVISARATNTTDLYYSLRYDFSIVIYNENNEPFKESKEDLFVLDPYQTKNLNQVSINTSLGNKIILFLLIYDEDDNLLGKNRIAFNEEEKDVIVIKPEAEPEIQTRDGLILSGLVLDETKTKFGKDFFDFFYLYYTFNKVDGEKAVKIAEERSFGRTTKIKISIEENILMEFITRPDNEYLEEMAKTAVKQVFIFFQKLKQEKSYIGQY